MKNKIILILIIFLIIISISIYFVYNYRKTTLQTQKVNNDYKTYYNMQILGTELVSILNKTADINEKNEIEKNSENMYIDNNINSIKIYVKLKYKDDYKTIELEKILNNGVENFIKSYATASFKCESISYHDKTKNVKELIFIETDD